MPTPQEQLHAAKLWIDSAVILLRAHRKAHDSYFTQNPNTPDVPAAQCNCTVCLTARVLLDKLPITEPPPDPRNVVRQTKGGLP